MRVAVLGGGVAGCMAAATAAECGAETVLYEKNEKLLKKMYITGKGRCNLTNAAEQAGLLAAVVSNARFLYSCFAAFGSQDTMNLFERLGVPLKIERGGRVFPVSDKSGDVTRALAGMPAHSGADVRLSENVSAITRSEDGFHVCAKRVERFDRVVVATGGLSYPVTGSTGDGYRFAEKLGHTVVPPVAGLSAVNTADACCKELAGLTLKNVGVSAAIGGKTRAKEFGELLFTHTGVSGPTVLTLSSKINRMNARDITLAIDLKPALDERELDARILRDFGGNVNRAFKNALSELLPKSLIPEVVRRSGIPPEKQVNRVTAAERGALVSVLKSFTLQPVGLAPISAAIITAGGVSTSEVNPKTMESKKLPGLYFCGEVLDVDAVTGGFNIQIALSTGYAAGRAQGVAE